MKNPVKSAFAILAVSAIALHGCFDLTSNATDAQASLKETVSDATNTEISQMSCGFDSRSTTERMQDKEGVMMTLPMASEPEGLIYVINVPNENRRFTACNMPESMKRDGMRITFSGEVKEIMPEERWIATPFKLSSVKIME